MKRLVVTAPARDDLLAVWHYLACENPDAADRAVDRIEQKLELINRVPSIYPFHTEIGPPYQVAIVRPYSIFFVACDDHIEVRRILHHARDVSRLVSAG